jgi:hypothetical protein
MDTGMYIDEDMGMDIDMDMYIRGHGHNMTKAISAR